MRIYDKQINHAKPDIVRLHENILSESTFTAKYTY